jgi:hypothetical protein
VISEIRHLTMDELEAGLDEIRRAPKDEGVLRLIVRRPQIEEREVLEEGELHLDEGLVGDCWKTRGSSSTADGSANPEMQINIMSARVVALVAQDKTRWQLAGDQLYLDMDLSAENLPAGTQLAIGSAVIEVTPPPHLGCRKFVFPFWTRRNEVCKFFCREGASSAWHQRQGNSTGHDSGGKRGEETAAEQRLITFLAESN